MKKLFLLFLFPVYLFSFFDETDTSNYDSCECSAANGGWVNYHNEISQTYTWATRTFKRGSTCITNSSRNAIILDNLQEVSAPYHSFDLLDVRDSCVSCSDEEDYFNAECVPKCEQGTVRVDTGECVQEEDTFECREGYSEQYTIGINTLPTPCSDFDPTMYSDAYTAVHETADTHQVCCVKALPEPTASTPDSNNTPIDLEPTNEILEDIKESSDSASSTNSDNLAQIDEDIKGTNSRLDDVKEILDGIKTDANQSQASSDNNRDNNTDRQLSNDNAIANQAHQDQLTNQGKYDDIILNLRTVTPAIQTMTANANANSQREIDTANANAQESNAQNQENSDRNHEDLEGIKDAVEGLKDDEESEQSMQGALDRIDEAIETASQSRETILGTYSNLLGDFTDSPPTFVSQGACVLDFNIFGRNLSIDMNFLEEMRPYTELFFSLVIAYLTFKIYLGIFIFFSFMIKV